MDTPWRACRLPEQEAQEAQIAADVAVRFQITNSNSIGCPAYFLQGIRSSLLRLGQETREKYEQKYLRAQPEIIDVLCSAVSTRVGAHAAVVVPPSSRQDARPYADAILARGLADLDLSSHLERTESNFRARSERSYAAVRSSVRFVGIPTSTPPPSLIVVDDILSSGRSVAATVLALREGGFIDQETQILVVAVIATPPGRHRPEEAPPNSPEPVQSRGLDVVVGQTTESQSLQPAGGRGLRAKRVEGPS